MKPHATQHVEEPNLADRRVIPGLAARLNALFDTSPNPATGRRWTGEEFAAAMTAAGFPITEPYLSQLRTGARGNPSAQNLTGIAKVFGVSIDYLITGER